LVQERMNTLSEAPGMLGFLFVDERDFRVDPDDAAKVLGPDSAPVLEAAAEALGGLTEWTTDDIEKALRAALVDGLGKKPKSAFGPVRVAVTGRRVSPPLFESLELLGRDRSLRRIQQARSKAAE
jgi:glutamyl-tRNA synthetase